MEITNGHVVSISYTLKDDNGNTIDSSKGQDPLSFIQGAGLVIQGMENAVMGRKQGENFSVTIPPEEGYGEYKSEMITSIPKDKIDGIDSFEIGMQVQAKTNDGIQIFTVKEIHENSILFDENHPLAGKNLHFDVTIEDIREATDEERDHGHVH